ncbi:MULTISPECIES: GNAT family N-acetyltransferase [Pseudomonas]|jgi:putative acetyltransferase|uniref:GNAT family N-acetyltransferase n=2 Tax=Pseudomonas TaxID=286 RepID=A0A9Q6YD90_PSEFR|nr:MULTISPECIES: GNAT family N-acetyltransferase [Pseudomonas]AOA08590.1 GNAT family N-acetyltransferase [Pseudomonas sp. TMW 2.1634]ARQ73717.1 GNAT family N-acetyltransferase [Pseudomonas fragi]ASC88243.1 GNAT family N-acetyltransferase [Pseudomonas fragi]MBM1206817.1 GNAT family N-acetyltransferase [Pseudomonas fragi]NNB00077.1 GNAT family N-acetyltransferase [Pseudomonas fragi]
MQHTWAIHTPRLTDFAELTNVWEASVRATHDFLPDSYIELLRGLVLEQYLDTVMLICCKDPTSKRITGFAGVAAGKVEMLFIHPDYRGLGIGKCLLMFAINELNAERLDVNEQNLQAVGFYLKQGFVAVGRCEKDGMGQPYPLLHLRYKRPARA